MGNMTIRTTGKRFNTFTQVGLVTSADATYDVSGSQSRSWITIKNDSTSPLTVYACAKGSQAAGYVMDYLAAATANGDGTGGSVTIQNYEGAISVAGTGIRFVVTELN